MFFLKNSSVADKALGSVLILVGTVIAFIPFYIVASAWFFFPVGGFWRNLIIAPGGLLCLVVLQFTALLLLMLWTSYIARRD